MEQKNTNITIAAIGDLHVKAISHGAYANLMTEISKSADVLILCGDLTDTGTEEEVKVLAEELSSCTIPVVGVLGNHDYENSQEKEVMRILGEQHVVILEGTEYIFEKNGRKIGITGVKGFGGGFRPYMWGRFGEKEQKEFYDALNTEIQNLENGLNRLFAEGLDGIVVILHYSPIRETLEGEVYELYPFLGSTRLEEVIDRYKVSLVFHGHAHYGSPKGKTAGGVPVYNVAHPVMQKASPKTPFATVRI